MSPSIGDLHPAQNRGFRELYAATRHVTDHYRRLGQIFDAEALHEGAAAARRMLDDLQRVTRTYDLHGFPAAQNVGATGTKALSGVGERFLERNQALRIAVLDVQHVVTLLGYLGRLSEANGNQDLVDFCSTWQQTMRQVEDQMRAAAIEQGVRPGEAIQPLHDNVGGRAGHRVQTAIGTVGEWFDRTVARRRG
jgi:hypothetical protein